MDTGSGFVELVHGAMEDEDHDGAGNKEENKPDVYQPLTSISDSNWTVGEVVLQDGSVINVFLTTERPYRLCVSHLLQNVS